MKNAKKEIISDALRALYPNIIVYTLGEIAEKVVLIITAGILGEFADAVFSLDFNQGKSYFIKLIVCLVISILGVPLLGTGGEITLFINSLRHDRYILGRFLDKKYESVMNIDDGEAEAKLELDPISLRVDLTHFIVKFVVIPFPLIFLLYRSIRIDAIYTLIVIAVSIVKLTVPILTKHLQAKIDKNNREYEEKERALELEVTTKSCSVRLMGITDAMISRVKGLFEEYYKSTIKTGTIYNASINSIMSILDQLSVILILFVGAYLAGNGVISTGAIAEMTGFFAIYNSLFRDIDNLIRKPAIIRNEIDRVSVLYSDFDSTSGSFLEDFRNISLRNIEYTIEDKKILKGVSLTISKGDKVALVGENGSGKTTLLRILTGLYSNYSGTIEWNGKDMRTLNRYDIYNMISYVTQDPYLFKGTVEDNIRCGNPGADNSKIQSVMEYMGITYLAKREVEFEDRSLSGGEAQRISLARALIRDVPIIIMDEPNNNLDAETLGLMRELISNTDQTVLFVSHDYRLICSASNIVEL